MSKWEEAIARQAQAEANALRAIKPPVVNSLSDIRRVVAMLDPNAIDNKPAELVPISADIMTRDADGVRRVFHATANTQTKSRRETLLEGLQLIRTRRELADKAASLVKPLVVNGRTMQNLSPLAEESYLSIDPLIARWLAATRDGDRIVWVLHDGFTYYYDIFTHRLTKKSTE